MGHRKIVIYISMTFIVAGLLLALYFIARTPEKPVHRTNLAEGKVIVFKDVKYSGEKKGAVDWELRAKVARKYIDKPLIELETLTGQYKPKDGGLVTFKGTKGSMDTDNESGKVEDVDVLYKGEYSLKSAYMDFNFKTGITTTKAPVEITGTKLTMRGVGLTANTNEETVRLERDVSGIIITEKKAKYRFEADRLTYAIKQNQYTLEGKVIFKGENLSLLCERLLIFTNGQDLERVEAYGKVNVMSRGTVAKSEKAVYHFKEGKIVFTQFPIVLKDRMEMKGESITYTTNDGKLSVNQPKIRVKE